MPITCDRLTILPGQTLTIDANWEEFNEILEELGDKRSSRITYNNGQLKIMVPLPEHEAKKCFLATFVEILLDEFDLDFYPLGATTFRNLAMGQGVEPDHCFYIQNADAVRGKKRLDLTIDPPPDLALEIDLTSRSHPEIYAKLGVPELWQYSQRGLEIRQLDRANQTYISTLTSQYFPGLDLVETLPLYLKRSETEKRKPLLKAFKTWVQKQIPSD